MPQKIQSKIWKQIELEKVLIPLKMPLFDNMFKIVIMGNENQTCTNPCLERCQIPQTDKELTSPIKIVISDSESEQNVIKSLKKLDEQSNFSLSSLNLFNQMLQRGRVSNAKLSPIHQSLMYMLKQSPTLRRLKSQIMDVPFEVVRLTTSQKLNHVLQTFGQLLMSKYLKQEFKLQKWKLHKKGYYINYLAQNLYAVFTMKSYFEGYLVEKGKEFLPAKDGILISQEGMYIGQFEDGKASGEGFFQQIDTNTIYRGQWAEGALIKGTIQNNQLTFEGCFQKAEAHGNGVVYFKQSKFKYKGHLQNGQFHDQKGELQCNNYKYLGGFQNGYKSGLGCLTEKQKFTKGKQKMYIPCQIFEGKWHKDRFEGKKRYVVTTRKEIQQHQFR